jgi:hypothetical protein
LVLQAAFGHELHADADAEERGALVDPGEDGVLQPVE